MPDRAPSRTAQGVALLRAAHQLLDARPLVLDDPVILRLLGSTAAREISEAAARFQAPAARALRAHVVLRSRFAEDRLAAAARRGITQCIVLGAGFDTFAFRQPDWARSLRVIEVDQPASQARKREQLAAAKIPTPSNVTFAAIDFERESLRDGLMRNGVALDESTFFSCLGVTMYLIESAVDAILETVAECPAGSEIVFTFAPPRPPDEASDGSARGPTLAERAASIGEPWQSYFATEALESKLRRLGFPTVEFLTPMEAHRLYFASRDDDLPAPKRTTIVSAIR